MIRSIVRASLRFRFVVLLLAAALLFFGIRQLPGMAVDVFPEFAPMRAEIQTICLGLSAQEVEALVTVPLEQELNGVQGLELMRSKSVGDLSSIELLFKQGTDILRARQLVQERMSECHAEPADLGSAARPDAAGVGDRPVHEDRTVVEEHAAHRHVHDRILDHPSPAAARARRGERGDLGERIKMPQVRVDPERMQKYGVSLDDVMEHTADALDVGILFYSKGALIGTGWLHRHAEPAPGRTHRVPAGDPQTTWPGCRSARSTSRTAAP
jgi:Cu/Ag efflux pump CusA